MGLGRVSIVAEASTCLNDIGDVAMRGRSLGVMIFPNRRRCVDAELALSWRPCNRDRRMSSANDCSHHAISGGTPTTSMMRFEDRVGEEDAAGAIQVGGILGSVFIKKVGLCRCRALDLVAEGMLDRPAPLPAPLLQIHRAGAACFENVLVSIG